VQIHSAFRIVSRGRENSIVLGIYGSENFPPDDDLLSLCETLTDRSKCLFIKMLEPKRVPGKIQHRLYDQNNPALELPSLGWRRCTSCEDSFQDGCMPSPCMHGVCMFCLLAERNIRNEHICQYPGCNASYEISELVEEEKLRTKFFAPYIIGLEDVVFMRKMLASRICSHMILVHFPAVINNLYNFIYS